MLEVAAMRTWAAKALTQRIITRASRAGGSGVISSNLDHVAEPCTQPSQLQRSGRLHHLLHQASRSSQPRPLAMAGHNSVFPIVALPLVYRQSPSYQPLCKLLFPLPHSFLLLMAMVHSVVVDPEGDDSELQFQ